MYDHQDFSYGVRLVSAVDDPIRGRYVVATRASDIGDEILRESPILVYNDSKVIEAYIEANEVTRALVDRLYAPASGSCGSRYEASKYVLGRRLAGLEKDLFLDDVEKIQQLLLIAELNGHDYELGRTALFVTASKAAHSCVPNCRFALVDGMLIYDAIQTIAPGDEIAFNYLGADATLFQTTAQRRATLKERYGFWCNCRRCSEPDALRSVRCPRCKVNSAVLTSQYQVDYTPNDAWTCGLCGALNEKENASIRQSEHAVFKERKYLENEIAKPQGVALIDRTRIASAISRATESLSWCHYHVASLHVLESRLCLSILALKSKLHALGLPVAETNLETDHMLAMHAVSAAFACVQIGECLAFACSIANTKRFPRCMAQNKHASIYENVATVYEAAGLILQYDLLGQHRRFLPVLAKYLPLIKLYSPHDSLIAKIEAELASKSNASIARRTHRQYKKNLRFLGKSKDEAHPTLSPRKPRRSDWH